MAMMEAAPAARYPVRVHMEYPERLSRLSTAFRILLAIPVLVFLALLGSGSFNTSWASGDGARDAGFGAGAFGGSAIVAIWATILVRGSIPRWLFDFQAGVNRFTTRAYAYFALLTDKYPAFEGDWVLNYDVDYPGRLSRWKLLFWKIITAIPHFFVLLFLNLAVIVVVFIAWFAVLFTGQFPRGLHTFAVGVLRWNSRVAAYVQSLTDVYPPFSLDEDAGPASNSTYVTAAIIGAVVTVLAIVLAAVLAAVLFTYFTKSKSVDVSYDAALAGTLRGSEQVIFMDDAIFTLQGGADPARPAFLEPRAGRRLVEMRVRFNPAPDAPSRKRFEIENDTLRLDTSEGVERPVFMTVDGRVPPLRGSGIRAPSGEIVALFEVESDAEVEELRGYPDADRDRHVAWQFE